MLQNQVVIKKIKLYPKVKPVIFPNKNEFHLEDISGEINKILVEDLKAINFVKSFDLNKTHKNNYNDEIVAPGGKVKISFVDGKTVIGYTLGYSSDRPSFYLSPADLKSNNERKFLVKSATKNINFV